MPLMNATSYVPQEDEPAMMTMADRTKAMEAHYGRLEREGRGQIVRLDDENFWFVPSDPEALGPDFIDALTSSTMPRAAKGAVIAAAFVNMEKRLFAALPEFNEQAIALLESIDSVESEARRQMTLIKTQTASLVDLPASKLAITDAVVERCAKAAFEKSASLLAAKYPIHGTGALDDEMWGGLEEHSRDHWRATIRTSLEAI